MSGRTASVGMTKAWRDRAALELRIRGASGGTIGDALAVVDAHCADSGQAAEEAFGTPRAYAESVPLSDDERRRLSPAMLARHAVPSVAGLAGMLLAFAVVDAVHAGDPVAIRAGVALAIAVMLCAAVALVAMGRVFLRHLWAGALLVATALAATIALEAGVRGTLARMPVWAAVAGAAALLAASVVLQYRDRDLDPVSDPLTGDPSPRSTAIVAALTPWLFPLMTGLGVALIAAINATA
ncbi:MAG: hypothetical protein KDC33_05920 [Thermoleophilia bacterium]|nr:hypothetical protein [Thermoleophilia bacterium]